MNYTVEFHRPEQLQNPFPKYQELITGLCKKVGKENVLSRIESISYEWAIQSGYYFKVVEDKHIFVHVSLNPKDFN